MPASHSDWSNWVLSDPFEKSVPGRADEQRVHLTCPDCGEVLEVSARTAKKNLSVHARRHKLQARCNGWEHLEMPQSKKSRPRSSFDEMQAKDRELEKKSKEVQALEAVVSSKDEDIGLLRKKMPETQQALIAHNTALSAQRDDLLAKDHALHATVRELTEQVQTLQIQLRDLTQDHDNTKRDVRDIGRAVGHRSDSAPSVRYILDAINALKNRPNAGGNGDLKKELLKLMHPDKNASKGRDELLESLGAATALINDKL